MGIYDIGTTYVVPDILMAKIAPAKFLALILELSSLPGLTLHEIRTYVHFEDPKFEDFDTIKKDVFDKMMASKLRELYQGLISEVLEKAQIEIEILPEAERILRIDGGYLDDKEPFANGRRLLFSMPISSPDIERVHQKFLGCDSSHTDGQMILMEW